MMDFMPNGQQTLKFDFFLRGNLLCKMAVGNRINILGIIVSIVFVTGCAKTREPAEMEPSYQGRSLSSWLADFDNPASPATEAMAAAAVRQIGSPALPFLIERLSEAQNDDYLRNLKRWQTSQENFRPPVLRPPSPRWEAFSGLDALGVLAMPALPDLQKLLAEKRPDPAVLYLAVRTGPAGLFMLNEYLTNNIPELRLEAKVLSDMLSENPEAFFPGNSVGPDAPTFRRRISELNIKVMQAAAVDYSRTHPQAGLPAQPAPLEPASSSKPVP